MVKKNQIDIGGIIVRTNKNWDQQNKILGKMYKITGNWGTNTMDLHGGWSIDRDHARLATHSEVEAFNKGARHLKEIVPSRVDNYSII